jgi:hypothetical protein
MKGSRFPAALPPLLPLSLLLLLLLAFTRPIFGGDAVEYTTNALGLASHASPDIVLDDVERTRRLIPELAPPLDRLEQDMRTGAKEVYPAFVRGRDGKVYALHFFGYSLLAALPLKLFSLLGVAPFKAFQVVNYAALFILGLALRRFFGSSARAWLGLGLFLGCGGVLYLNWTSPEFLSAACLLAALLLFVSGAPLAGGLLGGVASLQNPTIVVFFLFAPLIKWQHMEARPTRRDWLGLILGAAVFALPPLFNLFEYGVPNIIATRFTDPQLVSATRLFSFWFDLNQGMAIGIPGLLAALALCNWRGSEAWRMAATLGLCLLFTLGLALPALAVLNWNSGAAGVMRYAFWAAMPLLLALLLRLRARTAWPLLPAAALALAQAAAMAHAASYDYLEFSPLARLAMRHAPRWVHPEPEIFAERSEGREQTGRHVDAGRVYGYGEGAARKTLLPTRVPGNGASVGALLCGEGASLDAGNRFAGSAPGWRYLDAPVRCTAAAAQAVRYGAAQFRSRGAIALASGWSAVEDHGRGWSGAWSAGAHSRLVLVPPAGLRPATVVLTGQYFEGNTRTRVRIGGLDLGWRRLDRDPELALPPIRPGIPIVIDLEHEAPRAPGAEDPRLLAFFLHQVSLAPARCRGYVGALSNGAHGTRPLESTQHGLRRSDRKGMRW